jgi:hypothetical protein
LTMSAAFKPKYLKSSSGSPETPNLSLTPTILTGTGHSCTHARHVVQARRTSRRDWIHCLNSTPGAGRKSSKLAFSKRKTKGNFIEKCIEKSKIL